MTYSCSIDESKIADVVKYSDEELREWYKSLENECFMFDLAVQIGIANDVDSATQTQALFDILYRIVKLTEGEECAREWLGELQAEGGFKEALTECALASAARKVAESDLKKYTETPDAQDVCGFQSRVKAFFAAEQRF